MANPAPSRRTGPIARASLALAALFIVTAAQATEPAGEILASTGPTMRLRPHQLSSPVRPGSPVHAGDRFRTGPAARLELRMRDGAVLAIGPDSEFAIDEFALGEDRQRAFFTLARGLVRTVSGLIGKQRHEDFRLQTPTAVMGIRGTDFTVEQDVCAPVNGCDDGLPPGERLSVAVHEGRVSVTNPHGSVVVPQGKTLRMAGRDTAPSLEPPVRAPGAVPKRLSMPVSQLSTGVDRHYEPLLLDEIGPRR